MEFQNYTRTIFLIINFELCANNKIIIFFQDIPTANRFLTTVCVDTQWAGDGLKVGGGSAETTGAPGGEGVAPLATMRLSRHLWARREATEGARPALNSD